MEKHDKYENSRRAFVYRNERIGVEHRSFTTSTQHSDRQFASKFEFGMSCAIMNISNSRFDKNQFCLVLSWQLLLVWVDGMERPITVR